MTIGPSLKVALSGFLLAAACGSEGSDGSASLAIEDAEPREGIAGTQIAITISGVGFRTDVTTYVSGSEASVEVPEVTVGGVALESVFLPDSGHIEASNFDGNWTLSLENSTGARRCRGFVLGRVQITDGKFKGIVSHSQAGDFSLTGSIAPDGTLRNVIASGTTEVVFTGTLNGSSGAGHWSEKNKFGCKGGWTVKKRSR